MTTPPDAVRRYQQRVGGSGTTGDEFQFIETVPATAYDAVVRDNEALRAALGIIVAGRPHYRRGCDAARIASAALKEPKP